MKDAERIYALFVQANPVPDPDLLTLRTDEPVLLTIERSQDMTTQVPVESRPARRTTRRNVLVTAGAFAAVLVVGLVTVLLVTGGESGPVAAGDARPEVVFDGSTCTYDGPTRIEEGTVEFTIVNSAPEMFTLNLWRMEGDALEAELLRTPVGSDMAMTPADSTPPGEFVLGRPTFQNSTQTGAWGFGAGTYLVDCVTQTPTGTINHVWRPARFEVLAP